MSDEPIKKLFEEAIEADPYDGVTRKIFADWLEEHGHDDEAVVQRSWTPEKQQAEDWLTEYAQEHNLSYGDLIRAAHQLLDTGETSHVGVDMWNILFDPLRREELWARFALATGRGPGGAVDDFLQSDWVDDGDDGCAQCSWEREDPEEGRNDPYGDDFYNERGW